MIKSIVNQQLWTLVVPGGYSYIILLLWFVEICKAPINQAQLFLFVIDNNIQWLDIPMHNSMRVAIVKCLQYFVDVESVMEIIHCTDKHLGFNAGHVLIDEAGSFRNGVTEDIIQSNYIRASK